MFNDLPRVRLDGGARNFRRRWGYDSATQPPTLLEDIEEDGDDFSDTYSLRGETYVGTRQGRTGSLSSFFVHRQTVTRPRF